MKMVMNQQGQRAIELTLFGEVDLNDAQILEAEIMECLQQGHRYFRVSLNHCSRIQEGVFDRLRQLSMRAKEHLGGIHFIAHQKPVFLRLKADKLPVSLYGTSSLKEMVH